MWNQTCEDSPVTISLDHFVKSRWAPWDILCISITENISSQKCVLPKSIVFHLGLKREILPSKDSNLTLSALLLCNSFRPVFCLTQHIICKWIFKDLHIYITEFLSLKFSKSAKFCPEYVNFLLVSHSWEHSGSEHVCCSLQSQTLKHFSVAFASPTNVDFCSEFSLHTYLCYPLCIHVF